MEERIAMAGGPERPMEEATATTAPSGPTPGPPHLADPRALTILTTEHWGLLTARSLVYNEAFARAGMFLTFLTGSLVALGFVSQGSGFGPEFLVVAAGVLVVDLLIGLMTLGRVNAAASEEFRALQGMARLRHAYIEMVPTLGPYLSTSYYDDMIGALDSYGATTERTSLLGEISHGMTTAPGMVATICSVICGALAGTLLMLAGVGPGGALLGALGGAAGAFLILTWAIMRQFLRLNERLDVRFPRPPAAPSASADGAPAP
jgi:hypothetical protein